MNRTPYYAMRIEKNQWIDWIGLLARQKYHIIPSVVNIIGVLIAKLPG